MYVSATDSGIFEATARDDAAGQIALHFDSRITVSRSTGTAIRAEGSSVAKSRFSDSSTEIGSEATLPGMRFTEPFLSSGSYYVCAYLSRNECTQTLSAQVSRALSQTESAITRHRNEAASLSALPALRAGVGKEGHRPGCGVQTLILARRTGRAASAHAKATVRRTLPDKNCVNRIQKKAPRRQENKPAAARQNRFFLTSRPHPIRWQNWRRLSALSCSNCSFPPQATPATENLSRTYSKKCNARKQVQHKPCTSHISARNDDVISEITGNDTQAGAVLVTQGN